MSSSLSSKRALITAGAQGIGLAISRALLRAGCDVFVTYLSSADEASALIQEAKDIIEFSVYCNTVLNEPIQEVQHCATSGGRMPIDPLTLKIFWTLIEREREIRQCPVYLNQAI